MRIFFWSADSSGCGYFRCELPAQGLAALRHDTHVASLMPDEWRDADVVVGQRCCLPGATTRWQQMARAGKTKLVFELDDDLLAVEPDNPPAWSFYSRPEIRENLIRNIQVSDLVTVSTAPLAEAISKYNRNIIIAPNFIPASLLEWERPIAPRVTLGWSGGASHASDLTELGGALTQFMNRNPDVDLHVMGDASAAKSLCKSIPQRQVRFTPWVESVPAFHRSIDFDISLAPLRPSKFNRSKSALRCLEAAALGIPVVASDFGAYAEFVRNGGTGFLARQSHKWGTYLRALLEPELRSTMGKAARELAAGHTVEHNAHIWEKALCA